MKKFFILVAMVMGLSTTAFATTEDDIFAKLERLMYEIPVNSIEYKVTKFEHYDLNFNADLERFSKYLKLNESQKAIMFSINNDLAREFARLNTIENYDERNEWFKKTVSQIMRSTSLILEKEQFRNFRKIVMTTLVNRGFYANGQLVDIYATEKK